MSLLTRLPTASLTAASKRSVAVPLVGLAQTHRCCYSTSPLPSAFLDYGVSPPITPSQSGITLLTLNRAEAKNAINTQMLDELHQAVTDLQDGDGRTRALIINSIVPGTFCAGADLKERHTMSKQAFHKWHTKLNQTFRGIAELPFPVIAAMDGLALGGGLELALAADMRVAGPLTTKLGLPETRHAIIPGAGGTQLLSRLVGPSRAKHLIFTGRIFDRQYAHQLGIIDELAEEGLESGENHGHANRNEAGLRLALNIAQKIGEGGPLALQAAKAAINRGLEMDINNAMEWEKSCYRTLFQTKDREEGLLAFKEKRKPSYTGE